MNHQNSKQIEKHEIKERKMRRT